MLSDINAQNCGAAQHPISLITANGWTEANEVADVKLSALPDPVQPYVLNQTPAVLSVGTMCVDQGYSFVWRRVVNPFLFVLTEKSSNSRLKVMSQFWMTHAKSSQRNGFRRTSISRNCSQCADEDQLDELVSDDACHEYLRRRKTEDLISEAASAQHQFTHFTKYPSCRTCQRARMMAPHARQKRIETEVFGRLATTSSATMSSSRNVEEGFVYTGNKQTLNHINKHKPATCKGERNICTVSPWPSSPEGGVKTPAVTVRPYVPFTPSDSSIGLVQKVSRAYRLFRSPHCDIVGWPDKIHKLNMNYILNTYIYDCCKIDEVPDCHDLAPTNGGGSSLPKR